MLSVEILFYHRYVDDIALVPRYKINDFLNAFNSLHPRLQFILKIEDNQLNFLNVMIISNKGKLEFDWNRKPTFSGKTLNFLSHHPTSQKRGVVINMIDRIFYCHIQDIIKEILTFIIETFIKNVFYNLYLIQYV